VTSSTAITVITFRRIMLISLPPPRPISRRDRL